MKELNLFYSNELEYGVLQTESEKIWDEALKLLNFDIKRHNLYSRIYKAIKKKKGELYKLKIDFENFDDTESPSLRLRTEQSVTLPESLKDVLDLYNDGFTKPRIKKQV